MKIENAELGYSCVVPDRPTVRQQLEYFSLIADARGADKLERYWAGAKALISAWQCPDMPDVNVSLDTIDSPKQVSIIINAGTRVVRHMSNLDDIPPNS